MPLYARTVRTALELHQQSCTAWTEARRPHSCPHSCPHSQRMFLSGSFQECVAPDQGGSGGYRGGTPDGWVSQHGTGRSKKTSGLSREESTSLSYVNPLYSGASHSQQLGLSGGACRMVLLQQAGCGGDRGSCSSRRGLRGSLCLDGFPPPQERLSRVLGLELLPVGRRQRPGALWPRRDHERETEEP